ncbi:BTB/POZ domain-containing protein At3g49900 [Rutidosis leptorrhynchoides]|uniref:BTB/POZ domain-containing protein At3g49900 n=1 Tax=Rutidosis leptorrhynchoides TaxID=125765 RepID=UPI003A99DC9F
MKSELLEDWPILKVVETIFEEHSGDDSSSSTTPSFTSPHPPFSPSTTSLCSRVKLWSLTYGTETDVTVHVQGTNFHLHKDPLTRCSGYLKRKLTESSQVTISPPLKITSHTFTLVMDFCYGGHLFITPFNVASLLLAAELLEMTHDSKNVDINLRQKTEAYLCRTVAVDHDYGAVVLKSCMGLLPDIETISGVVSRCIAAMKLNVGVVGDVSTWFDGVQDLSGQDFKLFVAALHSRLNGSHDLLYKIVDFYIKEKGGKMSEEEGSKICNYIDCSNLSPETLMHAVQNPRMPLRFVVQAMFIEQLNTRRSVFSATQTLKNHGSIKHPSATNSVTLGAILQRDAALHQVATLKATMEYTSSRIQSLEEELDGMRKILKKSDTVQVANGRVKSESFRFSSERKVERGQKGSVSSGSFPVVDMGNDSEYSGDQVSPRRFGKRVMNGLKSAFRKSSLGRNRDELKTEKKRN